MKEDLKPIKNYYTNPFNKPAQQSFNNQVDLEILAMALKKLDKSQTYPSMIDIPSKTGSVYIKVEHILRAEAEGSYCRVYTTCGATYTLSNNLKYLERQLNPKFFFRCHHSHVVNLGKVKEVVTDAGTYAIMENNSEVDISKRKKNDFFNAMKKYIYN